MNGFAGTALQAQRRPKRKWAYRLECWILADLRHHTFFSLAEQNQCVRALLDEFNQKPFKQLPDNRRSAVLNPDVSALWIMKLAGPLCIPRVAGFRSLPDSPLLLPWQGHAQYQVLQDHDSLSSQQSFLNFPPPRTGR